MELLHPSQNDIARDQHRFRILACGRKFGKTTLAAEEAKAAAFAHKDRRVIYVAPTLTDARRLMWERLRKSLGGIITYTNETRNEFKIRTIDQGESTIFLGSWEMVQNYRGDEFDFIIFDEVQDYRNFWVGWHEAIRPTLSPRRGSALFMGTPKGFNHFYDLYNLEAKDQDYKSFHFTSYDNPHAFRDEIEKAKIELPEDQFAQEYLADFRKQHGLVYREFNRDLHLFDDFTAHRETAEIIGGVDFGYTNPSAILKIVHDVDNHYWVTDEWYKAGKTNAELIEVARSLGINVFYPDPAEPDRIEEMRRAGLNIRDVSKDIPKGIDAVRELFKQNRLHIHKQCQNLISELEMYKYPDRRPDNNEPEKPVKEHDHACDALRYPLYSNASVETMQSDFNLYGTTYE